MCIFPVAQVLEILDKVGDELKIKYSSMSVPEFSEEDEEFLRR